MLPRCRTINQKLVAASRAALCARRPRAPAVRPLQPSRLGSGSRFNVPLSAEFVARVSGIPTMARLPFQETADGLDAAFVGVPIDTGTSNRPGARWALRILMMVFEGAAVREEGACLCRSHEVNTQGCCCFLIHAPVKRIYKKGKGEK